MITPSNPRTESPRPTSLRAGPAPNISRSKKRRDDIAANKVGNAKEWDVVVAEDIIDMNKQKFVNLKADLVTDGVLTQARADAIFDTPPA
jgi:hypothetical protein